MSISKIKTGSITADAVSTSKIATDAITEAKIADSAIEKEHINSNVITGQTELSANAASNDVLLVYDTSAGVIKKISASNVGLQAPTISSVSPTNLISGDGTGNYTITITGTGYTADVTAKLVKQGGSDLAFDTVTRNSSTQLTCVIAKSSILNADEPFDVVVTTAGALTVTDTDAITVDATPAFVTSAGSLGTFDEGDSISVSVNATDPESAGNVTFELQSGTLPAGLSLTNTAAEGGTAIISGTLSELVADTTYNFTLRAVDAASNTSSRSFSITVLNKLFETFTSSGTFSVPSGISAVDVLVVAGGGAGRGGGGGAGGLIYFPCYPVTPGGTIPVTVGEGGIKGTYSTVICGVSVNGQNSVFDTLTAIGGGSGGGNYTEVGPTNPNYPNPSYTPFPGPDIAKRNGGSGGGGGYGAFNIEACGTLGGQGNQPTQPGNSGAYGFGNPGAPGRNPNAYGGESTVPVQQGGGGGAGASGNAGSGQNIGGQGGIGKAYTIADGTTPVYYAGGGGGGAFNGATTAGGCGGQGGGGNGGFCGSPTNGTPVGAQTAQANKGGGGGGGNQGAYCTGDTMGGKGIVIVRWGT